MRQIILEHPGRFRATTCPSPSRRDDEALVRIHRIGVCGTDLHAFAGRQPFFTYPRVLGHELGVEIIEVPSGEFDLKPGDHCAIEPYLNCGRCSMCRAGRYNCCEQLQVLGVHIDGAMSGLFAIPINKLHKSTKLALDQLALVETLGIGEHAVQRSGLKVGESVLIVGAGPIGLSVLQFAQAAGGEVRVLDISPSRRTFVERFGVEAIAEPNSRLYDVVFDATGNASAMEASIQHVAFGGRIIFVGIVQAKIAFDDPLLHRREITILASRNSNYAFPKIIRMIEDGVIDTTPWITHRMELANVPAEFPALPQQAGLVKAMIEVSDADV